MLSVVQTGYDNTNVLVHKLGKETGFFCMRKISVSHSFPHPCTVCYASLGPPDFREHISKNKVVLLTYYLIICCIHVKEIFCESLCSKAMSDSSSL